MAQGGKRNNFISRTTCVSPLWKHPTSNNVVKLRMQPPQTTFTPLDTFLAAHSPRRFCQARQKYILKPLTVEKRMADIGYAPVQQKTRNNSSETKTSIHKRQTDVPQRNPNGNIPTDSSSEKENGNQRVLPLGKCNIDNEDLGSTNLSRRSFFPPRPKLPVSLNRSASSIPTMPHGTSDLIAIGTIPITTHRQTPVKPMSRSSSEEEIQPLHKTKPGGLWKTKATLNLKELYSSGCKYPDPMVGAGPSFQGRITEMAQLEVETIRFEKTKKTRKKVSSS
ncbi:uncharacterized protein LOC111337751 isoform X3 [Stylophora pistillata]|uniref:Uncharacterized protein n=1 Tax=Stylophora pistillata TaxID=50429 RepID=A0A2B4RSM9_STYPI|nr:uncharacterized protein LOC111337751 isoform X3 [Stylophora pistillata]PFX19803.1 hypothetical protein AWC38_SpisGene15775 [Stylophora pistillata]